MDYYQTPELQRHKNYKIDLVKSEAGHQLGQWIFEYAAKTEYSEERLEAFYIIGELQAKSFREVRAANQYSDCLVDTTAQVFVKNAKETGVRYRDSIPTKADAFNDYIEQVLKRPQFNTKILTYSWDLTPSILKSRGKKPNSAKKNSTRGQTPIGRSTVQNL
jgi:hypothetical protein